MKSIFRSLRHRNFRLYFIGQGTSVGGTWMQSIAMGWLAYRLTGSKTMFGVVGCTSQMLTFFLAPLAGILADRWNRRRTLVAAQSLAMVQAVVLGALTVTGHISVPLLIVLSVFTGMVRGFEVPMRQSFLYEMVGKAEDLPNAIALNSFLVNTARLVGPLAAGFLVEWTGEGVVFLINGLTYLAVIAALLAMRVPVRPKVERPMRIFHEIGEGLRYTFGSRQFRPILLMLAVTSLAGIPYMWLMPVFAKEVLGGGPSTLGYLKAAEAVGALVGAVFLASRRSFHRMGRLLRLAALAFGAGLVAFSFSDQLWLSLVLLAWPGAAMILQVSSSNTLLQTLADEDKRGRVMSCYAMMFMGMIPFGNLLAGVMADLVGAPTTVMIGGSICILGALILGPYLPNLGDHVSPREEAVAA